MKTKTLIIDSNKNSFVSLLGLLSSHVHYFGCGNFLLNFYFFLCVMSSYRKSKLERESWSLHFCQELFLIILKINMFQMDIRTLGKNIELLCFEIVINQCLKSLICIRTIRYEQTYPNFRIASLSKQILLSMHLFKNVICFA